MKSHNWLLEALLRDSAMQCNVPLKEVERDLCTISKRVELEGESFLTITLPTLDSEIIRSLANGHLPSNGLPNFGSSAGFPNFLRGFLRLVFDANGKLLDEPSVVAVACLRQICLTYKKVEAQCSDARVAAAMQKYVEIDSSLPDVPNCLDSRLETSEKGVTAPSVNELGRHFGLLFRDAFLPLDRKIYEGEPLDTKHGPGATAERVKGNDKYRWTQWTERLAETFPSDLYLHALESGGGENQAAVHVPFETVAPGNEMPVRVIHVPKTMKTPRIIAIEPVVMQYMQQGLLDGMTKGIKSSVMGDSVLFDDQSVNSKRALEGSKDGHNATLDLSDASDRVSFWLVEALFGGRFPALFAGLTSTRSHRARVPVVGGKSLPTGSLSGNVPARTSADVGRCVSHLPLIQPEACGSDSQCPQGCDATGGDRNGRRVEHGHGPGMGSGGHAQRSVQCDVGQSETDCYAHVARERPGGLRAEYSIVQLRKFASMGSAVCFPVEAVVFATIAFAGVADSRCLPLTRRTIRQLAPSVSVFGDDIIVPVDAAPRVALYLEAYGLKVNRRKSFWTGLFRESCGTDAFMGVDVTPTYMKTFVWGDRQSLAWLAQWVEFSNGLYFRGFWETARVIREKIADLGFVIPMVAETSPAIGYHNVRGTYEWSSWQKDLQRPAVKAFSYRSKKVHDPLDGIAALRKCLMTSFNEDPKHLLETAERSSSVRTKMRWTSPF